MNALLIFIFVYFSPAIHAFIGMNGLRREVENYQNAFQRLQKSSNEQLNNEGEFPLNECRGTTQVLCPKGCFSFILKMSTFKPNYRYNLSKVQRKLIQMRRNQIFK